MSLFDKWTCIKRRSFYDARDLVDLFIIKKETKIALSFPKLDCQIIKNSYNERLKEIKETKKEAAKYSKMKLDLEEISPEDIFEVVEFEKKETLSSIEMQNTTTCDFCEKVINFEENLSGLSFLGKNLHAKNAVKMQQIMHLKTGQFQLMQILLT